MKVCFETFGCRLSRAEALDQEAEFAARGWIRTEGHADADLIVVRGCSVTRHAQRDCERLVEHIKRKYPFKRLVVTGCLADKTKPFVLKQRTDGVPPPVPTRTARAYLKVQDGCAGKCAFCIVPKFRGTGCNLALYASDGKRLPDLLAALTDVAPPPLGAGACRIRLGSLEPTPVAREIIDVIAERENACRFLHIPIQSGSNRILSLTSRPYSMKDVSEIVHLARERVPGIALGCDMMTGFPGEGDLDFLSTQGLISRARFERVHVFPFSERPGTAAAAMPGAVPDETRRARARELAAMADKQRSAAARGFIGKTVEFVVEDEKTCSGWTSEYFWCSCPHSHAARKSIARAKVRSTDGHMLMGEIS